MRHSIHTLVLAAILTSGSFAGLEAQDPPPLPDPTTVNPGAPGQESRQLTAEELRVPPRPRHTQADVAFMQNMIHHHEQALMMSRLAPSRTEREEILRLAARIERAQGDEIALMERWLELRGEEVPDRSGDSAHGHHPHHDHGHHGPMMAGMLTQEELDELATAQGAEFDRLFLEFMIYHHEGAILMVEELMASPGAAQDTDIFHFASEVDNDQSVEIDRMRALLREVG